MLNPLKDIGNKTNYSFIWSTDYDQPVNLIDATSATYLKSNVFQVRWREFLKTLKKRERQ